MKKLKKQVKATKILGMITLLGLFVVLTSVSGVSAASTVYVNATGGSDGNLGTIDSPYQTIGKGISSVEENGKVQIANGIYTENTFLTISKNMTITGQNQKKTIINGTNTFRIFHINNGVNVTIANLTLTDVKGTNGGGAICNQGKLTVTNCTFTDNNAGQFCDGGAILNEGNIGLRGCTFTNNFADLRGGAICNIGTITTLSGCTFSNNTVMGEGGAISNYGTITTLSGCTFTSNHASNSGGAICNYGILTANYNRIVNNTAWSGNAIYCHGNSMNATLNWWGSNTNPQNIPNLIVAEDGGSIDASTWVILTVNANPTTINNTQTSVITADLNHYTNSIGYVGKISKHIPDGTIILDIPWGSFTSSGITHSITLNTLEGVANAVFYANEGAVNISYNPVKVTASADDYTTNDTESTYITINKITKLYLKTTSSNKNPKVGEKFLLTYKLGNYGPDEAKNVTITFQIPEGLDFVNILVDSGKYSYNETTRTVTWTLDSVPVGDPYLYLTVKAAGDGTYKITPSVTSETYNINSGDFGIITFEVQSNSNNSSNGSSNSENRVNAASKITKTIGLQNTGLPLNYLLLAVLIVLGGLIPKRK